MQNGLIGAMIFAAVLVPACGATQETDDGQPPPVPGGREPWYVSLDMSMGAVNDPLAEDRYGADQGSEFGAALGLGYRFERVRLEGQFRYENFILNSFDLFVSSPITAADLWGFGLTGNVFYDFGVPGGVRPFVGVGAGFFHLKADYREINCLIFCSVEPRVVRGTDTVAAGQAMAGISFPWAAGSGEWFIGYRFLATDDIGVDVIGVGPVTQRGVKSHSVMLGARYQFSP
ncbi:MAG: outer membrane beta-barrel protein [Alphaproteobacteria bacterium]|nr:outer membrane beta-barrel protein [Alphaproteobacteria bacterium]